MAETRIYAGLDIGTTKITAIVAEADESGEGIRIIGVGSAPSDGLKRGVVVNLEKTTRSIQVAVQDARLLAAADPKATLVIIEGMNHVLKMVPADRAIQVKSYSDPTLPVAPQLIDAIASFVTGVRRR